MSTKTHLYQSWWLCCLRHRSAASQFWNCISKSCWGHECWSVTFVSCCESSSLCNKVVTCAEEANHLCVYHSCVWSSNHIRGSLDLILNVMPQKKNRFVHFIVFGHTTHKLNRILWKYVVGFLVFWNPYFPCVITSVLWFSIIIIVIMIIAIS